MGRTLKRVPLDFHWQTGVIWKGYNNPYQPTPCKVCDNSGYSQEGLILNNLWYRHLLDDAQSLFIELMMERANAGITPSAGFKNFCQFVHYFLGERICWQSHLRQGDVDALWAEKRLHDFTDKPTVEAVNQWSKTGFGHDCINQWVCIDARLKAWGLEKNCLWCNGNGNYFCDEQTFRPLYENWEAVEPPVGDGYQLWETTSDGSPVSPVCKTLNELCEWLEKNGASVHGHTTANKATWKKMLEEDNVHVRSGNLVFL